jgi:NADH dehydrogenase (ubiquinone) 1 beta subcomplex subunit 11
MKKAQPTKIISRKICKKSLIIQSWVVGPSHFKVFSVKSKSYENRKMSALIRLNNSANLRKVLALAAQRNARCISTSQKQKSDTATVTQTGKVDFSEEAVAKSKNWVSWGFDFKDEAADRAAMKGSFFFSVTLCLVFGSFVWAYLPDNQMRDWAQREGYLELRRRESLGLDPISRDYVDPATVELPSDEDLGNTEIII